MTIDLEKQYQKIHSGVNRKDKAENILDHYYQNNENKLVTDYVYSDFLEEIRVSNNPVKMIGLASLTFAEEELETAKTLLSRHDFYVGEDVTDEVKVLTALSIAKVVDKLERKDGTKLPSSVDYTDGIIEILTLKKSVNAMDDPLEKSITIQKKELLTQKKSIIERIKNKIFKENTKEEKNLKKANKIQ